MGRVSGLRRMVVQAAAVAGTALLVWAGAPFGQAAHAAPARETMAQALVGRWSGPAIADTGECGPEYGEWIFFANHEYSYTMNSDYQEYYNNQGELTRINDCGGITNAGRYVVRGSTIILYGHELTYPYATFPPYTVPFRFYTINYLILYADRAYEYQRE
jgi:hypothetical protein